MLHLLKCKATWLCTCDCGENKVIMSGNLHNGTSRSCGCRNGQPRHGLRNTPEYRAWSAMKTRCYNKKTGDKYRIYGGRGITVCREWLHNFPAFLEHIGNRPSTGHSLDRINNNGNYEPGNVRWATRKEQQQNRRPWSQW